MQRRASFAGLEAARKLWVDRVAVVWLSRKGAAHVSGRVVGRKGRPWTMEQAVTAEKQRGKWAGDHTSVVAFVGGLRVG